MKITKTNTNRKGLLIIVLLTILSIALNIVLSINLIGQENRIEATNRSDLADKEKTIVSLQEEIKELNGQVINSTPEERENISNTNLEEQNNYKKVANEFVTQYLTYNTKELDKRRESIGGITSPELLDKVAPEVIETDKQVLSSDPTFTSNVLESTIYITEINETLNTVKAIVDVKYETKNTEGESTSRALIKLDLQKSEANNINITDYIYYPVTD